MLKSMTGFGRGEYSDENVKITVEMKSVNHRYNEVAVKMPKVLGFYESSVRNLLKKYVNRGKVDIFISYEDFTEGKTKVTYHEDVAKAYLELTKSMSESFGLENDIRVSTLARFPEVFTIDDAKEDEEELWNHIQSAVVSACEQFVKARLAEGENLGKDINEKLSFLEELVEQVKERSPQIVEEYRNRITEKVNELLGDTKVDEAVLATEIILFADKICTDEEVVRLSSHIKHMRETLQEAENIGRKLDFIAQEMNREANTILSKANDITISNIAINLKTEIEKIREQIQNIE
ncbi:MAG: YicC family protein [Lachnospiraceae bacterium]|nr:YicC family protein [Lachnospiraceae bacterium]